MPLFGFLKGAKANTGAQIRGIDAATAHNWHSAEGCVFIDIREDHEFRSERIPGAHPAPLSRFSRALPGGRETSRAVFYCLSGARTRSNIALLATAGFAEAYILEGGIRAWRAQGAPIER